MLDILSNSAPASIRNLKKISIMVTGTLSLVFLGSVGYYFIEGWSFADSLYMTVITVTTVGFGEVYPLSTEGRLLTALLIFLGFGLFAFSCTQLAKMVIEGEFTNFFGSRIMKKRIDQLNEHFIVCGYGRVGTTVCSELKKQNIDFVLIDSDEDQVLRAKQDGYYAFCGNATDDDTLLDVGIQKAFGLVCLTGDDSVNLFITLSARELNHSLYIVARGEDKNIEQKLLRSGADVVIVPSMIGGLQIAHLVLLTKNKDIEEEMEISSASAEGFHLKTYFHAGGLVSPIEDVVKQTHALIPICLIKSENEKISLPKPSTLIHPNESLILLVQDKDLVPQQMKFKEKKIKKILIADDHHSLLTLFEKKFKAAGFDVTTAQTGQEALDRIHEVKPNIVILDVTMPLLSGYEVCQQVKQEESLRHIPIILFSAESMDELNLKGKQAGADLCLAKTIRSSELLQVVEDLMDTMVQ